MTAPALSGIVEIECDGQTAVALGSAGSRPVSQASSISKQLMAVVVLQQVRERRLALSDRVGRRLATAPPAWADITVHQLLTHTSGLGHWQDVAGLDLGGGVARPEVDALIAAAPLVSAPGTRFAYSGPGYLTLAAIAEAVDERAYSDIVTDRVLVPAGMAASSSGRPRAGDPDVAIGSHAGVEVAVHPVFTALPGTGDLWTTTHDLLAFAAALRDGRLLDPASLQAMTRRHVTVDAVPSSDVIHADAYGYGTFLGTVARHPARFHPGDNPGYRSLLAYLPEQHLDVAVLLHDDEVGLGPVVERAVRHTLDAAR